MSGNFFDKIPTIQELLESPPLKQLMGVASRNVVMTNVKSFVERMATDVQSRAAEMKVPSVGELAERIAEWIKRQAASGPHAEINATGVLLPPAAGLPLADEALQAIHLAMHDYVRDHSAAQRSAAKLLQELTGAEAALVTGTHSGSLLLALAATCRDKPAVVARGQVGEIEAGISLPRIAASAGAGLRECGTVERTLLSDYADGLAEAGAALALLGTRYAVAGGDGLVPISQLAAEAKRHRVPTIVDLGMGGIVDPARFQLKDVPHAAEIIAAGAELVIMAGDRLLGGPSCGVILGREATIAALRKHDLYASLAAPLLTLLPLAATLQLQQDPATADRAIPLFSLLSTSPENLKSRAERMASQFAAHPLVASAEVVSGQASLSGTELPGQQLPTWRIAVTPQTVTALELAAKLTRAAIPVATVTDSGRLYVDLRTVLPRQDLHLVDSFDALRKADDPAEPEESQIQPS